MILVTGAAGKTGKAVLQALAQTGQSVRAWLRRPEQAQDLPIADTIVGDLEDSRLWREACGGIDALYLICPNMYRHELQVGKLALQAAQQAGVERFVYHSVLHPQTEKMPHHWQKLRVEEEIFRSGLPFTILQPCAYMQNRACLPGTDSDNRPVCRTLQRPRALCAGRSGRRCPGRGKVTHRIRPCRGHLRVGRTCQSVFGGDSTNSGRPIATTCCGFSNAPRQLGAVRKRQRNAQ